MVKPINIVLVEHSFLIISGVEKMFAEFPGTVLAGVFDGDEKNLANLVLSINPDIVIVNPELLGEKLNLFVKSFDNQTETVLIGLCSENIKANVRSRFRNMLEIGSEKHELMQQFKQIVRPLLKNEEENKDDLSLSDREKNILRMVALGLSSMEIADKLFLSIHTINTHRKNILRKLGIKTVSGLMVYSLLNRLVSLEEIEGK